MAVDKERLRMFIGNAKIAMMYLDEALTNLEASINRHDNLLSSPYYQVFAMHGEQETDIKSEEELMIACEKSVKTAILLISGGEVTNG